MREREIEAYFVKRVKDVGGLCRKFVSPGRRGVPDQIVVYLGSVFFVELKAPGEALRPEQEREHARLFEAGADVFMAGTYERVDAFIEYMRRTTC